MGGDGSRDGREAHGGECDGVHVLDATTGALRGVRRYKYVAELAFSC
jgi:hypothetical protein